MVRIAIGVGVVLLVQTMLALWAVRRLDELAHIRERLSRLADGLALLTDTTEAGLATIARELQQQQGSKRWKPPSEPTIRRTLQQMDANAADAKIGQWMTQRYPLAGRGVAVDGKALRGAHDAGQRAPHLLSAILHEEGVVIGQIEVEEKTNEIPKLPDLLGPLPLEGAMVTADALHTQTESARYIVEEKKADYLFIVKDNQPTLRQDISDLKLESFPPSPHHGR
jgi:hypothetical protein